jgi:hypothetical protein
VLDKTRIGSNKNRTITFSSEFDSGNCEEIKKLEDFKVFPLFSISNLNKY